MNSKYSLSLLPDKKRTLSYYYLYINTYYSSVLFINMITFYNINIYKKNVFSALQMPDDNLSTNRMFWIQPRALLITKGLCDSYEQDVDDKILTY